MYSLPSYKQLHWISIWKHSLKTNGKLINKYISDPFPLSVLLPFTLSVITKPITTLIRGEESRCVLIWPLWECQIWLSVSGKCLKSFCSCLSMSSLHKVLISLACNNSCWAWDIFIYIGFSCNTLKRTICKFCYVVKESIPLVLGADKYIFV